METSATVDTGSDSLAQGGNPLGGQSTRNIRRDSGGGFSLYNCLMRRQLGQGAGRFPPWTFQRTVSSHTSLMQRLILRRHLKGHVGCVNTVSFTQDGDTLLSGSDDRKIILWNWEAGQQALKYPSGHTGNVFQARMMPFASNNTIVTCAADGQVRVGFLREGANGKNVETHQAGFHHGRAHKLALEPMSPHCFYSCGEDGVVRRYDLREPEQFGNREILAVDTGRSHSYFRGRLEIYAAAIGAVTPWHLALACGDEAVRVYDLRKTMASDSDHGPPGGRVSRLRRPDLIHRLCPKHLRGIPGSHTTCVAFSCSGEILATYGDDDIYLFDYTGRGRVVAAGGECGAKPGDGQNGAADIRANGGRQAEPREVEVSEVEVGGSEQARPVTTDDRLDEPPNASVAIGAGDGVQQEPESLQSHPLDLMMMSDGNSDIGFEEGNHEGSHLQDLEGNITSVSSGSSVLPDLLSDSSDESEESQAMSEDESGSSDGSSMPGLLSGSSTSSGSEDEGAVRSWLGQRRAQSSNSEKNSESEEDDCNDDQVLQRFSGHLNRRTVKGVNFFGGADEYVVSGSDCGSVFIWQKATGKLLWTGRGDNNVVNCLEKHPTLPLTLATSGIDNTIKIWEPAGVKPNKDTRPSGIRGLRPGSARFAIPFQLGGGVGSVQSPEMLMELLEEALASGHLPVAVSDLAQAMQEMRNAAMAAQEVLQSNGTGHREERPGDTAEEDEGDEDGSYNSYDDLSPDDMVFDDEYDEDDIDYGIDNEGGPRPPPCATQ